jgi:undecaprenol kinase/diacylglycerol kinase (ATP)
MEGIVAMSKPPVPPQLPSEQEKSECAKFIAGFGYAFAGLWYALRTQRNMWVHVIVAILAILLGIALRISAVEFAMIFVAITGVFIAEMFNTVFEICVDLASPEYHPLAKIAKDVAAGAECHACRCDWRVRVWATFVGADKRIRGYTMMHP